MSFISKESPTEHKEVEPSVSSARTEAEILQDMQDARDYIEKEQTKTENPAYGSADNVDQATVRLQQLEEELESLRSNSSR